MNTDFNYLFVSDFHIALGQDPETNAYHPREDFFYDDEFFRFLRWADTNRENRQPWELVFVGDCFDFIPVELAWYDEYQNIYDQLVRTLVQSATRETLKPWDFFFHLSNFDLPVNVRDDLLLLFAQHRLLRLKAVGRDEIQNYALINRQEIELNSEGQPDAGSGDESGTSPGDSAEGIPEDREYEPPASAFDPCGSDWWDRYRYIKIPDEERLFDHYRLEYAWGNNLVEIPDWAESTIRKQYAQSGPTFENTDNNIFLEGIKFSPRQFLQFRFNRPKHLADLQYRLLTDGAMSAKKLCAIHAGHKTFFEALAWWIAQGHKLILIRGNHDLEIAWEQAQQRFKELVYFSYRENYQGWASPPMVIDPVAFKDRIDFNNGWFYYKEGVFFAQHGDQYDNINGAINLLNPYQTRDKQKLNPAFGNLGVATFVAYMEDQYPEWENEGKYSATLTRLLKDHPWRTARLISVNIWSFAYLSWRLWRDTGGLRPNLDEQLPTRAEINRYAERIGLDEGVTQQIYCSWDRPLFMLAWFRVLAIVALFVFGILSSFLNNLLKIIKWLFHPKGGFVVPLTLLLLLIIKPAVRKWVTHLISEIGSWRIIDPIRWLSWLFGSALGILVFGLIGRALLSGVMEIIQQYQAKKHKKFFQTAFYHDYIFEGAKGVYRIFRANFQAEREELVPRYYIMGHDHHPGQQWLGRSPTYEGRPFTFFNTGSWLPSFDDKGIRRLRKGGPDNEFTFLKIWHSPIKTYPGEGVDNYEAALLRWNDHAGRADRQLTIAPRQTEEQKVSGTLVAAFVVGGVLIGVYTRNVLPWVTGGLALGFISLISNWFRRSRREEAALTRDQFLFEEEFQAGTNDCLAQES